MPAKRSRLITMRKAAGHTQEALAEAVGVDRSTVARWEAGETAPQPALRLKLAAVLGTTIDELTHLFQGDGSSGLALWSGDPPGDPEGDELAALDLARRVRASDVGEETLSRLELVVDDLATRYPSTPPQELVARVRTHLSYVVSLLDARKTLAEHRRLVVVGGWLSLLAATLYIDIKQGATATAHLRTARSIAHEAEHTEIEAWCLETSAWRQLTDSNLPEALVLAHGAQALAPRGSSVAIQATAQEGRIHARLGQPTDTYEVLGRVTQLVSPLERPDTPEHHYRYDPNKATSYIATTLAWINDPAAESYARETVRLLEQVDGNAGWPRRLASAYIDLALALLAADLPEEASARAQASMLSGRLVPSNHWRGLEVVRAVEAKKLPEAVDLREAYEVMRKSAG